MVAHESISVFGGFAPFPNTIMIPTMGLQSDVIGFRFGFGYEKGKRTLRAMSNEQFNNLNEEAEQAIYKHHDTTAINFFKLEIQNWTNLQKIIIEKSVEIEKMKADRTPSAMAEIIQEFNTAVSREGATVTWENLAETWNNFFGGNQVFNNNINSGGTTTSTTTSTTPTTTTPTITQITVVATSTIHDITTRIWSDSSITTSGTPETPNASFTYTWAGGTNTTKHMSQNQHHGVVMAIWQYGKSKGDHNLMNMAVAYSHAWAKQYQQFFVGLN